MASTPEVSVVIPTKNRWILLERTLRSALRQEHVDFEIIVVDDGGSDETSDGVEGLGDPRVVVVRNPRSLGPAGARNVGMGAARANWVSFLDDDDLWASRKLALQLAVVTESNAGWAYCAATVVNDDLDVIASVEPPTPAEEIAEALCMRNAVPAAGSNVLASRAELERLGGFDEGLAHLDDWDMWLRLALAQPAGVCPEVLVAYVDHGAGRHITEARQLLTDFERMARKQQREGVTLDGLAYSRWVAAAHRRRGNRRDAALAYLWGAVRCRNAGNLARAGGVLLGEWAMSFGRDRHACGPLVAPEWIAEFR